MEDSQGIEILIKNRTPYLLVNVLILDEISQKFKEYTIVNVANTKQLKALFSDIKLLQVDRSHTTLKQKDTLEKLGVKKIKWTHGIVSDLRRVKTNEEIRAIRRSQEINLQAFQGVLAEVKLGMTEFEIAALMKMQHIRLGATGESFEPIVAFTEEWAIPHHTNSRERRLMKWDQILFDFGCVYDGYCSDMTRVVFTTVPSVEQKRYYDLLKYVTHECMKYGKIGMKYRDLHAKARELLGEYDKYFTHNLWHGIGVDVHETPLGMKKLSDTIQENEVFTIEPGLYFPGRYGFRYENIVVATKDGLVDILWSYEEGEYVLGL